MPALLIFAHGFAANARVPHGIGTHAPLLLRTPLPIARISVPSVGFGPQLLFDGPASLRETLKQKLGRKVFPAPRAKKGFGARELFGYLWPQRGAHMAKARVVGALIILFIAKLFVVRVPLIFKRCIDSLSTTSSPLTPALWMLLYGFSRALYTMLQETRYLLFTPVGQNALRRFMRDAFEHVQLLDTAWLGSQSTGELSRVFARGVRGMNSLLRLLVFNVLPTLLEALLVIMLLGRRYGGPFLVTSLATITAFVAWTLYVVEKRVALLVALNEDDNRIYAKFFNSLLNNEAVRSFTNERHEVEQYDNLLGSVERKSVQDVQTISALNAGQALIFSAGLGTVMALCARRVLLGGTLTIGDVVAIHGMLLQLQQPLVGLGFTYQEIRTSLTDMKQLLLLRDKVCCFRGASQDRPRRLRSDPSPSTLALSFN